MTCQLTNQITPGAPTGEAFIWFAHGSRCNREEFGMYAAEAMPEHLDDLAAMTEVLSAWAAARVRDPEEVATA
jgi:hypothetical protein